MTTRISTSISRSMPEDIARMYIEDFRDQYGEAHYYFAQHAAFPLALTPDLLYRLRQVFQHTTNGKRFDIPWIAIADLLLSPLCEEIDIGYELYEMDVRVRTLLLKDLQANPLFETTRIDELALFLRNYVERQLPGSDSLTRDLVQSQTWTALAYIKPDQVAQELAEQIKDLYIKGSIEQIRITSILETLKALDTPLAALEGFQPLLTYSQIQAHSFLGRKPVSDAANLIKQTTQRVADSLNIDLPLDREEIQKERSDRTHQTISMQSDFYISHHIADHDWAAWIARQLQKEGYSVTWNYEYGTNSTLYTSSLHNQAHYTIALLSSEYMNVENVQKEWETILAESQQQGQRVLLPIRVRECTPQGIFAAIQHLDLVGQDRNRARQMLLRLITQSLNESKIQELKRRIRVDQDVNAYVELGKLYERSKRIEDAIQAYEGAQNLQPQNGDVLFALSRLYNDTGDYEQAIASLNQLIGLQPDFAAAYEQRGLVYRRKADMEYVETEDEERRAKEYKLAIADFERAVELQPDFEDALGALGGLYRRLEDYEQATHYYQRLYEVNNNSSYALGNLASLSWYLGHVEDARRYFDLLEGAAQVRIEAEMDRAYWDYYDLALGQLATGERAAARETYAKAIEETPAVAQLDAVLSNLYFLQRAREHIEGLEEIIAMIENAKDVKGEGEA